MMVAVREAMRQIAAFDAANAPESAELRAWLRQRREALGDGRMAAMVQYIDDSCAVSLHDVVSASGRRRGEHHCDIFDAVMAEAGVELAEGEKREESMVELEALGVMVSVVESCVYYPAGKQRRVEGVIDRLLREAAAGRMVERTQVESLMGKLKWVAHVVPSMAPRLRSGFAMAHARGRPRFVRASADFVADQQAIRAEMGHLPRVPLVPRSAFPPLQAAQSIVGFQDAAGEWGIGGFFGRGSKLYFFQEKYPVDVLQALRSRSISIATTELAAELALVQMVAAVRRAEGQETAAVYVTDFTDNEGARAAAQRGTATSPAMAPIAEEMARLAAAEGIALRTARVTTDENKLADGLSRNSRAQLEWAVADAGVEAVELAVDASVWDRVRGCYLTE
jgi:hypothetical protein